MFYRIGQKENFMKTFEGYNIRGLHLKNRVVMPPMCMNMAIDGVAQDFHLIHYGNAALGEIGLVIVEATGVNPEGRILDKDLGIWNEEQVAGHRMITDVLHKYGSKAGIQLGHAGRKCRIEGISPVAPTAIAYNGEYDQPREMTKSDIEEVVEAFRSAAIRAVDAGYDLIELHGAHGYLMHEFLSPLTNRRNDEFGGSLENRTRLLKMTARAVRDVIPENIPLILRVSASDYFEGGIDIDEMVKIVDILKEDLDMVHVSSGGLVEEQKIRVYPGYQVRFSEEIRKRCQIPTIAVGLLTDIKQVEEILSNDRADLVALGRVLLRDPFILIKESHGLITPLFAYKRGFNVEWRKK